MLTKSFQNITLPYFKYILLAALMYIPLFGYLDTLPIRAWDEARLAINAYEMLNNGNYIVTYFEGKPDMWNTKPPLLIWIQVLFMKIIGVNELAVRLPSAIAGFFTCIALLVFSVRYLKSAWFGVIASFVLITSQGYVGMHATRTGDYDAMVTLFITLSGLCFFAYCQNQKNKYLYFFFIAMALAVLTKSITGLLFVPALFIYSLIQKQFIPLFKNKHFYLGFLLFIIPVLGYYFLREAYNPGYIAAVRGNELGGRYLEVTEGHSGNFWFYFDNLLDWRRIPWPLFIPCGFIIGFLIKNKPIRQLTLFLFLMIFSFFIIISLGQTKLFWYDVPLYPFLSMVAAAFVYYIFNLLKNIKIFYNTLSANVIPYIFLFLLCVTPYRQIIDKTYKPIDRDIYWDDHELGYYLKDAIKGKNDLDQKYLLFDGYKAHNLFYIHILNDKGTHVSFKDWTSLQPQDVVIAQQNTVKDYLKSHYDYEIIHSKGNVVTYKINAIHEP